VRPATEKKKADQKRIARCAHSPWGRSRFPQENGSDPFLFPFDYRF